MLPFAECKRPGCTAKFQRRNVRQIYCSRECLRWKPETGAALPSVNKPRVTEFIGVDGEGIGRGQNHHYVLLGVGDVQREWPEGVTDLTELFRFLYDCYLANPDAIFSGFYLSYDFNMWLKLLPRERAWMLISPQGIGKRARRSAMGARLGPFPVEWRDWEFDQLAFKRFKLRPRGSDKWLYICDAGPFFQTSLLKAIDPTKWQEPIVTPEEFELIKTGKERRDSAALDDDMRFYNRLENEVFARLMKRLELGLGHANVKLKKQQWFGPGQAAQAWMRLGNKLIATTSATRRSPIEVLEAAIATYYAGWFEIPIHGHIPGVTYEYDVNSAYPFVSSNLPCLCGRWRHGKGTPPRNTHALRMVRVYVWGKDPCLGPLPYRREDGRILRPRYTAGWYWQHEVNAAKRAGLVRDVTYSEYWEYEPCVHFPPLRQLNGLYESRQRIGKDTPEGKAFKLVYNSVYGKFAQSEGEPVFANPIYASLITAGCRTMILDAIATHPQKSAAVAMVATDGVYFLSPHPKLDQRISERMGDWSRAERHNLTCFKPGVYWDDAARQAITQGRAPQFKSRGINAADFAQSISAVDKLFSSWGSWLSGMPPGRDDWPSVTFRARFTQISIKQALDWTAGMSEDPAKQIAVYKRLAGVVQEGKKLVQDSYPDVKRNPQQIRFDGSVWRSEPWDGGPHWPESQPYDRRFGMDDDTGGFSGYAMPEGPAMMTFRQALGVG